MIREYTCAWCGKPGTTVFPRQSCCSEECSNQHKTRVKGERRLAELEAMPEIPCPYCGTTFKRQRKFQKYCTVRCQQKQVDRRKVDAQIAQRAAVRAMRRCQDCNDDISARHWGAVLCKQCAADRQSVRRAKINGRRPPATKKERVEAVAKPAPKAKPKPKPEPVEKKTVKKEDMVMPNLAGDWFPGWDGCWSPSIEPEWRTRIERLFGPAPMPLKEAS